MSRQTIVVLGSGSGRSVCNVKSILFVSYCARVGPIIENICSVQICGRVLNVKIYLLSINFNF